MFRSLDIHNCGDVPKNELEEILLYHVVGEVLFAEDLSDGDMLPTLLGDEVKIDFRNNGRVFVENAKIIDVDNAASNGVVHAINQVLIP